MTKKLTLKQNVDNNWFPATCSAGNRDIRHMRIIKDAIEFDTGVYVVKVREGDYTDLATVPRFLWAVIPPYGIDDLAFIVHDKMCYEKKATYIHAADTMRAIQEKLGVPKWRVRAMYYAVKWFGPRW